MANNSSFDPDTIVLDHVKILPVLVPAIAIGVVISILNMFTIGIILIRKRLRRPSNIPIISVLFGAAIQGLITTPTFVFKHLDGQKHREYWLCDFYRLPYFLCGHALKISLMVVSFDRCVAIKYPYIYRKIVTKRLLIITLILAWCIVIIVDMVPFLPFGKTPDSEGCHYVPRRTWGIIVISFFNIFPFIIIAINYVLIWKVAIQITFKEYYIKESLRSSSSLGSTFEQRKLPSLCAGRSTEANPLTIVGVPKGSINVENPLQSEYCDEKGQNLERPTNATKKRTKRSWKRSISRKTLRMAWEMKATKASVLLLIVYILCWGPLAILYMIDHYCQNCISENSTSSSTRFVVKAISFTSSVLLPLVYCWKTKEFRREVSRLVCQKPVTRFDIKDTQKSNESH